MSDNKVTFGKIFWPSLLAGFIITIVGLILFAMTIGGIIGSFSDFTPIAVKNNTVLHMTLDGAIQEKGKSQLNVSAMNVSHQYGLSDLLFGMEEAKKDPAIKGIFLEIGDIQCGYSTARELRNAINDFEKSGKFVVAYNSGEVISQKEYYIASAANENYAFPGSTMEITGLGAQLTFFKGTLDKLGVEVQVIRGSNNDFKSAVEPFFRSSMSDSSRLQMQRYMSSIWEDLKSDIAADRKINASKLDTIANNLSIRHAKDALKYKLIDGVIYRDEAMDIIRKKIGLSPAKDLTLQPFEAYAKDAFYEEQLLVKNEKPNIAVILAEGDVATSGDGVSSEKICRLFQLARKNKSIKTVVFRVNSPGGSALASDEIWREVQLTNKVKKVIVSMGDVAASGGYYISTAATRIFAEPTTVTGSIGVFGMIPYTGKMLEDKLGITFDQISTNKHSVLSLNRKLTPEELAVIQQEVDEIYSDFLHRVADGRHMTTTQVNKIARGRVWTGRDALKIGLVDELGGINDAIAYAAKLAGIKDAKVLYYPLKKQNAWLQVMEQLDNDDDEEAVETPETAIPEELLATYKQLKKIEQLSGIQMRIPYYFELN